MPFQIAGNEKSDIRSRAKGEETEWWCPQCGKSFRHSTFVDHLFASKDCMRKYWEEEEKTHAVRMRHRSRFDKFQRVRVSSSAYLVRAAEMLSGKKMKNNEEDNSEELSRQEKTR
jgi:hypothetical protein